MKTSTRAEDQRARGRRGGFIHARVSALLVALVLGGSGNARAQDTVYYVYTDAIGSVRMVTDANGQVVERDDYLPFGEPWPAPSGTQPRQFAGKEHDTETGLDYFGARYLEAQVGRFIQPDDPAFGDPYEPQTMNLYAYTLNNPLRYVDPDGHFEECPPPTNTSTCVEGRAGTRELAVDLVRWTLVGLLQTYWSWRQAEPIVKGDSPFVFFFGTATKGLMPVGAMRRMVFDEASSAARHVPGLARVRSAAGPINGQAALDTSVQVSVNSTRRIGIDYTARQFVVFDEHGAGVFHGHVRTWAELTQAMQAVLRRYGMVGAHGDILAGR